MKTTFSIRLPERFSLTAVISSHGWRHLAPFNSVRSGESLFYVDRLPSGTVYRLAIWEGEGQLTVEVEGPEPGQDLPRIKSRVSWMLGLEQNFADFYERVAQEPKLKHVIEQHKGRLLRSSTVFEDLIKTILTTNTSWGGTIRMVDNLVGRLGASCSHNPDQRAFPCPGVIAECAEAELRGEVKLGYRAPYVLELARRVQAGELDPEAWKTSALSTPDLEKTIREIKGVGAYAAAHMLMLLGRYDSVPVDSWARKMVSREWYQGEPVGRSEVEAAFARWGKWKGLAYWFWNWDD